MPDITHYPLLVFAIAVVTLTLASLFGSWFRRRCGDLSEGQKDDLSVILGASLTLLALIIGFSFSMATSRYDQRKNFEEAEANAIGTELLRADLLEPADATHIRDLLRAYLAHRIRFFTNKDDAQRLQIDRQTDLLEQELWAAVKHVGSVQPPSVATLVLSGMNDVINSQGYTQASYWNRIPVAAWCLMAAIAVCCNVLLGFRARQVGNVALVLPLVVSTSFLLIADIDAPRHGLIYVSPQNLESLAGSLEEVERGK